MARKNPEHFRAQMEFYFDRTYIGCSCGQFVFKPTTHEAFGWLLDHQRPIPAADIYKEN